MSCDIMLTQIGQKLLEILQQRIVVVPNFLQDVSDFVNLLFHSAEQSTNFATAEKMTTLMCTHLYISFYILNTVQYDKNKMTQFQNTQMALV